MQDYVRELLAIVDDGGRALAAVGEEGSTRPRAPGKWSPRQILGHLIDSAVVNKQRFVLAQIEDDLVFPGYRQDAWVAAQRYQEVAWEELVPLWAALNRHIAWVMRSALEAARQPERRRHNLHELAWAPVPPGVPATLDLFMRDYVEHLMHHLCQILGRGWTPGRPV